MGPAGAELPQLLPEKPSIVVEVPVVLAHVSLNRGKKPLEKVQKEDLQLLADNRPHPISGFGREEWPLSLVLAVDVSGSITSNLPLLRRAAREILAVLQPRDRLALLAFSHQARMIADFTGDRELILEELSLLEAHGGTALNDALFAAASALESQPAGRRRVILFLSDNRAMPANRHGEKEAIDKAHEAGAAVLGIHLPPDQDDSLKRLLGSLPDSGRVRAALKTAGDLYLFARETGGEVIRLKRNEDMKEAFRHMARRISSLYYLAFQPEAGISDGTLHPISVRLSSEGKKRWGSAEIVNRRFFRY